MHKQTKSGSDAALRPAAPIAQTNPSIRWVSIFIAILVAVLVAAPITALTQTRLSLRKNKYSLEQDVQVGRQVAAELEKELRLLRNSQIESYISRVGGGLVESIPREFQHNGFDYHFKVVDAKEINAFALPGGPMYLNTGMIIAAKTEGEMAGVMAHEIAHVALRHGTAQATRAAPYQTAGALGQIAGAILGGTLGGIVGAGSQIGASAYLLKFSREFETEADILGAQILANAGYDPRDLAEMFRTIQQQGGGGGPEFLSSHPNPANRYQRIEQEARLLRVSNTRTDNRDFERTKSLIGGLPSTAAAPGRGSGNDRPELGRGGIGRVEPPSGRFRQYSGSDVFRAQVPDNWRELPTDSNVWFAPEGGYGEISRQTVFSHAVSFGLERTQSRDLQRATQELIARFAQGNPGLQQSGSVRRNTLAGRTANYAAFVNNSEALGIQQTVEIYTTMLRSGDLFYIVTVAPRNEYRNYQRTFQYITQSLQLRD